MKWCRKNIKARVGNNPRVRGVGNAPLLLMPQRLLSLKKNHRVHMSDGEGGNSKRGVSKAY